MQNAILKFNSDTQYDFLNENSIDNRDDCLKPYRDLHEEFLRYDINLASKPMSPQSVAFEIHVNHQNDTFRHTPKYLLQLENSIVYPTNKETNKYTKVFTWSNNSMNKNKLISLMIPAKIGKYEYTLNEKRDLFLTLISSNKCPLQKSPLATYKEKFNLIKYLEDKWPNHFSLYGHDWNLPMARPGITNRIVRRILKKSQINVNQFPLSYKGTLDSKMSVLSNSTFTLAFENVKNLNGYVSEKIFDSMIYGAIPIYLGAKNITSYIPHDCFIDFNKFSSYKQLLEFLVEMPFSQIVAYRENAKQFLNSPASSLFSSKIFAETIVKSILFNE